MGGSRPGVRKIVTLCNYGNICIFNALLMSYPFPFLSFVRTRNYTNADHAVLQDVKLFIVLAHIWRMGNLFVGNFPLQCLADVLAPLLPGYESAKWLGVSVIFDDLLILEASVQSNILKSITLVWNHDVIEQWKLCVWELAFWCDDMSIHFT